jgi:hypothetical protein
MDEEIKNEIIAEMRKQQMKDRIMRDVQKEFNTDDNEEDDGMTEQLARNVRDEYRGSKKVDAKLAKKGLFKAGTKLGKVALGPVGLMMDWIPCIAKATFFLMAGTYSTDPTGFGIKWSILICAALYNAFSTFKDLQMLLASRSAISKVAMLPKIAWLAYYGIFLFNYGIPTTTEKDGFLINIVKASSFFIGVLYAILSAIIPVVLIADFIPAINVVAIPLSYILELALLFM